MATAHVLLVDLNNFARYPTLPIGYLASILRSAGHRVSVFAPLMVGIHGVTREKRPQRWSLMAAKLNHRIATSSKPWVRSLRDRWARRRMSGINNEQSAVLAAAVKEIERLRPDAVLVSTYLMYRDVCAALCEACSVMGIPVMVGGPYFAQPETIAEWTAIPGLSALIAGEVELRLPQILATVLAKADASVHVGVVCSDGKGGVRGQVAPPLKELDAVPFPDYSDFPWGAYPNRIVPVITGRGCGWGVCSFCSDVTSTAGRTFRSRSADNVLQEIAAHHHRYGVSRFVFTDLKMNSDPQVWRAVISGMQQAAPGSAWIGAVHAGGEADNGLSLDDLHTAAKAGCVRLTTGLETGSQRLADLMKKGTTLARLSDFFRAASDAGISARCTMIVGHPGETPEDVDASAEFLAHHGKFIERVSLNRLSLIAGTTLHRSTQRKPHKFKGFAIVSEDRAMAQVEHSHDIVHTAAHRRAVMRLITEAHRINARELSPRAADFEGVM